MLKLEINGRRVRVRKGATLLAAIREAGFEVPTLCHHDALEPYGACRLCVAEVRAPGRSKGKIVATCLYPAAADLVVETETPAVQATRREVLDLLLARCPNSEKIRQVAADHGVLRSSYPADHNRDNCILCGLCTRVCQKLGYSAIGMAGRGPDREVAPPLKEPPPDCVGCASCARICPTDNISYVERAGLRRIWERDFELAACKDCGTSYITKDHLASRLEASGLPAEHFELCDECSRLALAANMAKHLVLSEEDRDTRARAQAQAQAQAQAGARSAMMGSGPAHGGGK